MIIRPQDKRLSAVTMGSMLLVLSLNAQAQGGGYLEEVVVTANKQVENIQDVSKSIQVVGGSALEEHNITSIGDLQKLVPTIAGEGQTLAIRGVATEASTVNAPNKVGIVLDDVPLPSSTTYANNLYDIQRIEVLPGPQGTLAGRNATGGLVNMVTYGPEPELTGHVNLLGTSDEQYRASVVVAGPINDSIQFSTSLYNDWFQGLTKNINLDKWSSSRTYGLRQKLKFLVTDNFTVDLTGFYQKDHQDGDLLVAPFESVSDDMNWFADIYRRPFSEFQPGTTASRDNTEFASPRNGENTTTDKGGIASFSYVLPSDLTLTWINSYMEEDFDRDQDFGLGMIPLEDLNGLARPEYDGFVHQTKDIEYYTSEFRINSPADQPLRYVAGLFYSNEKSEIDFERLLFQTSNLRHFDTETLATYAHAEYDLTDQWTIEGGIRYEADEVDFDWTGRPLPETTKVNSDGMVRPVRAGADPFFATGDDDADFINFDIGAKYQMTPDVMFYATYAEAEQGPIYDSSDNVSASAGTLETLPQESVEAFEAGMKAQFFDQKLTLNVSLFHSEYEDYQVQTSVIDPTTGLVARKLSSVGKVRTKGVEVFASAFPTDRLRIDFNLAYTDAKILDFPNAPCYINAPVGPPGSDCYTVNAGTPSEFDTQGNLAGESLNRAPKVRATLILDYSVPLDIQGQGGMEAFIAPLVKYQSKQHTELLLDPTSFIDAKTFGDINLGVRSDNWTAELFVNNVGKTTQRTFIPQQGNRGTAFQNVIERVNERYYGARFRYNL
jgi:iron complex outermembrane receptor protein